MTSIINDVGSSLLSHQLLATQTNTKLVSFCVSTFDSIPDNPEALNYSMFLALSSQLVPKSTRTLVNSYLFWSTRT